MKNIKYINSNRIESSIELEDYPNKCPICKDNTHPEYFCAFGEFIESFNGFIQVIFRCSACGDFFMSYYTSSKSTTSSFLTLRNSFDLNINSENKFPKTIIEISPRFEKVYKQAEKAEKDGSDEICGPGYGKSLEILVKDYLIMKIPNEKQKIVGEKPLSKLLKRINDDNVKTCAERAFWLRNDEIHYERIWTNKDVKDLKLLINLIVSWIEYSIATDKIIDEMPNIARGTL